MNKLASLIVVGSGIKFLSHLTVETKTYIENADKVLYLVNEPLMKEWIQKTNPNSQSLDDIYFDHKLRLKSYIAITNYILEALRTQKHVCVVLYGHPAVYAQSALEAVRQAQKEGYYALLLPAVSAEDCLYADLLIDPGQYGSLSFDATDLLIRERQCDPTCHLILWQVGIIGALDHAHEHDNQLGLELLSSYLLRWYPENHELIFYEAAQYPHFKPIIKHFKLHELNQVKFSKISTLYVPPVKKAVINYNTIEKLKINPEHLKR